MSTHYNYISTTSTEDLIAFFVDYRDNYAVFNKSIIQMAEDYGLSTEEAKQLMRAGSKLKRKKANLK